MYIIYNVLYYYHMGGPLSIRLTYIFRQTVAFRRHSSPPGSLRLATLLSLDDSSA
jgi:hypothetical protein